MLKQMAPRKERYIQVHEGLPAFIVGLPEDSLAADLAKSKFADTVRFLKKMVPEIEARCKIKLIHNADKKSHFEVNVNIITPYAKHTYAGSGWDLAKIFDDMSESLRKRFAQDKPPKKHSGSVRQVEE